MSDSAAARVLGLIPAHNEGRHVAAVVRGALEHIPVLVVDDGSTDDTADQARAAGAEVLQQSPNQGKGAALLAGFDQTLRQEYDAVLTLDADGQHDPAEIPSFLTAYAHSRTDLIIGQRDFARMPPLRRAGNALGMRLFSWAVGQPVPDNQSGYRLISRRMMEAIRQPAERGFEFEVEMIVTCVLHGYSLGWVPIRTIYADENSHIQPFQHALRFIKISSQARQLIRAKRSKD